MVDMSIAQLKDLVGKIVVMEAPTKLKGFLEPIDIPYYGKISTFDDSTVTLNPCYDSTAYAKPKTTPATSLKSVISADGMRRAVEAQQRNFASLIENIAATAPGSSADEKIFNRVEITYICQLPGTENLSEKLS